MENRIHFDTCPVCNAADVQFLFEAKDHTVTNEVFPVWQCRNCQLRFTQDVPDAASISPYYKSEAYISHTDSSKGLVNNLYKKVRKITLKRKRRLIEKLSGRTSGNLLDIGSGTGSFVNEMVSNNWKVTGLEPDEDARAVAKTNYGLTLAEMVTLDLLPAKKFDVITMWHVLEHVHALHQTISTIDRILSDDGVLIIAVPNYTSRDAQHYRANWAAYDVPRHLYHFSPASINILMEQHGLKVVDMKGMWFDSYYVSMLSNRYATGKTKMFSALLQGLQSNMTARRDVSKCSSVIYVIRKVVY